MKRIGRAASRMAKGNLALYNFYVILISFIFAFFLFIITGATILFALTVVWYAGKEIIPSDFSSGWAAAPAVCMLSLSVVVSVFMLMAIIKNIKIAGIKKKRI